MNFISSYQTISLWLLLLFLLISLLLSNFFIVLQENLPVLVIVKIKESGLNLFYLSFIFLFIFIFLSIYFYFLFLEQLGLGLIGHAVTSVTTWWHSHKTDHRTRKNSAKDSRTNNIIQHGHHMLALWTTHGCLG